MNNDMEKEKSKLIMKCLLSTDDNGKTWHVESIDYLNYRTYPLKWMYELNTEFKNMTLIRKET